MKTVRLNFRVTETTRQRLDEIKQEWNSTKHIAWKMSNATITDVLVHLVNAEYDKIQKQLDAYTQALADVKDKRKAGKLQTTKGKK